MSSPPRSQIPGTGTPLQFSRYECKYLLSDHQAEVVRAYVEPYVEPDPFAARRPNGRYEISSLYLDTDRFRLLDETLEGLRNRFKLRIRAYSDRPDDPVFFEVKKRRDRKISKERSRIRRSDMMRFISSGTTNTDRMAASERGFYESFVTKTRVIDAKPRILVRYEREAYQGRFDTGSRVTFDRNLRSLPVYDAGVFFDRGGWNVVESGRVILELKFNEKHPPWMSEVIKLARLERISYSKYAHSVHASYRKGLMRSHVQ